MNEDFVENSFKIIIKEEKSADIELDACFYENQADKEKNQPLIILLHGWNNKRGELDYLISSLLKQNFKVMNYSFRGHGKSNGKKNLRSIYGDFKKVIDYIIEKMPNFDVKNINVIGQSLGAGISLTEGFKNNKIRHIFALNPFFNPKSTLKTNRNFLIKLYLRFTGFKINEEDVKFLAPEHILEQKSENNSRIFIIMTRNDSYIPFSEKEKLLNYLKLPKINYKIFDRGNHTFNGIQDKVSEQLIIWLRKLYPKN